MKVVALIVLRDGQDKALQTYAATVGPLVEKAGGTLVGRHEVREILAGSDAARFVTVVDYPDRAAISRVFDSDEYRALAPVIALAFARYDVLLVD